MRKIKLWMTYGYDLRIPSALKEEYYKGNLTSDQVIFLAEIEALTQHGKQTKHGCFPTNQFLAHAEGCSERRIRQMLHELEELDYLIITHVGNMRYIKTCWSDAERKAITYRKKKRKRGGSG